ncbi:unnamed protein product, partial [Didymodactylos carnosus]
MTITVDEHTLDECSYTDIGYYYPELLRLKELLKISTILSIIRSHCKIFQHTIEIIEIDHDSIEEYLAYIKRVITYPRATPMQIREELDKMLRHQNLLYSNVSNISEVENSIRYQLQNADDKQVERVVAAICKSFHCDNMSTTKRYIEQWLNNSSRKDELIKYLAATVKKYRQQKYSKLIDVIKDNGINLSAPIENIKLTNVKNECSWIPRIYLKSGRLSNASGYISLQPKLVKG